MTTTMNIHDCQPQLSFLSFHDHGAVSARVSFNEHIQIAFHFKTARECKAFLAGIDCGEGCMIYLMKLNEAIRDGWIANLDVNLANKHEMQRNGEMDYT